MPSPLLGRSCAANGASTLLVSLDQVTLILDSMTAIRTSSIDTVGRIL